MLKHFLNTSSLMSMVVRAPDDGSGAAEKTDVEKAREAIAKNTVVADKPAAVVPAAGDKEDDETDDDDDDESEDEDDEDKEDDNKEEGDKVEETAEAKTAREAKEAETEKEKRKSDRIQKRIDKAVALQRAAEAETLKWKAIAEAKPSDEKLTDAEVQSRAEAIAAEKVAAANLEKVQKDFDKACDKLQDGANKLDKEFDPKVKAMADELGPIPSRVIGILDDLENGSEVLKFLVDDIDEAEKIYDLKERPEKLAIALVRISDKLAAAKKPKPKALSKVPDPKTPVNGSRVVSNTITGKESTEEYIKKRTAQREELRKQRGY